MGESQAEGMTNEGSGDANPLMRRNARPLSPRLADRVNRFELSPLSAQVASTFKPRRSPVKSPQMGQNGTMSGSGSLRSPRSMTMSASASASSTSAADCLSGTSTAAPTSVNIACAIAAATKKTETATERSVGQTSSIAHLKGSRNEVPPVTSTPSSASITTVTIGGKEVDIGATDQLLQKCRTALEAQARDIEKERRERIALSRQFHDLDASLAQERVAHQTTQTQLNEERRRRTSESTRYEKELEGLRTMVDKSPSRQQNTAASPSSLKVNHQKLVTENTTQKSEINRVQHLLSMKELDAEKMEKKVRSLELSCSAKDEALTQTHSRISLLEQQLYTERTRSCEDSDHQLQIKLKEQERKWVEKVSEKDDELRKALKLFEEANAANKSEIDRFREKVSELEGREYELNRQLRAKADDTTYQRKEMQLVEDAFAQQKAILEEQLVSLKTSLQNTVRERQQKQEELQGAMEALNAAQNDKQVAEEHWQRRLSDQLLEQKTIADQCLEQRTVEIKKQHETEKDFYVREIERLQKICSGQAESADAVRDQMRQSLEETQRDAKVRESRLESELTELRDLLHVHENQKSEMLKLQGVLNEQNNAHAEYQREISTLRETVSSLNEQLKVLDEEWQSKWEKDRGALRNFYEQKIDNLQSRITNMRQEAVEVRKLIVGAAADMYNTYKSDDTDTFKSAPAASVKQFQKRPRSTSNPASKQSHINDVNAHPQRLVQSGELPVTGQPQSGELPVTGQPQRQRFAHSADLHDGHMKFPQASKPFAAQQTSTADHAHFQTRKASNGSDHGAAGTSAASAGHRMRPGSSFAARGSNAANPRTNPGKEYSNISAQKALERYKNLKNELDRTDEFLSRAGIKSNG